MRHYATACALLLLAVCVPSAAGIEAELTYHPGGKGNQMGAFHGLAFAKVEAGLPSRDVKVPADVKDGVHTTLELAGKAHVVVLVHDEERGTVNRLLFDANGNGDLMDDQPPEMQWQEQGGRVYANTQPIDIELGPDRPWRFALHVSFWLNEGETPSPAMLASRVSLYALSYGHYRANLVLDGVPYNLALVDADCDGRFDEPMSLREPEGAPSGRESRQRAFHYYKGDSLYLGSAGALGRDDKVELPTHLCSGGRLYRLALDIPGKKLSLTPVMQGLAPVTLGMETDRLLLSAKDGAQSVLLIEAGEQVFLPQGNYLPARYTSIRADEQGERWKVQACATLATPETEIGPSGGEIAFGEPFRPWTYIAPEFSERVRSQGAEAVALELVISDCIQARVQDVMRYDPGSGRGMRPKEPRYRIVGPDGGNAASGQFEYG